MQKLCSIFLMLLFCFPLWAQDTQTVAERNAAQGFNDTIDRLAPDFVRVSLVVADPGDILYTVLGHACLHLQCPAFNLDYIFSYESESVRGKVFRFLLNDLHMGMIAISTDEYIEAYIAEGRGVKEYQLNLPPEVKTELWRMCDERVMQGMDLEYDPVKHGCAISVVHSVEDAIRYANRKTGNSYQIQYTPWGKKGRRTIREIFYENAAKNWGLFWCMTIVAGRYVDNPHIPLSEKLIAPFELVGRWQQATISGVPIISKDPILLAPSVEHHTGAAFTPWMAALVLLLLSIVGWRLRKNYIDYLLLAIYTVFSLLVTYLLVFPSLPNTDWNWLIIPFNILPAICWKWRQYWALPYAVICAIWLLVMVCYPHRLIDPAYIPLTLAWIIVLLKQSPWLISKITNQNCIADSVQ